VNAVIGQIRLEAALGIGQDSVIVDIANMDFLRIASQQLFNLLMSLPAEAWFP